MNFSATPDSSHITRRIANADLIGLDNGALRLSTPALVIKLPELNRNIATMKAMCEAAGIELRPHAKTHKCAAIAHEQIAQGARGVCCATPREAVVLVGAGVTGILVTVPVVQPRHLAELADLHAAGADLMVVFDHPARVAAWEAVSNAFDRPLPALVDLDLGMMRTGAPSTEAAVAVAQAIDRSSALAYRGIQAYSGWVQHIERYRERREVYLAQIERLDRAISALGKAGLPPEIVSGGGTGTFAIDLDHGLYTECQVGSYIFMDVQYHAVELFSDRANPYGVSLLLRATVVSANVNGHVTLNAGIKSLATDGPVPVPIAPEGRRWRYEFFGDEYGMLVIEDGGAAPAVGSTVDLIASHCDPTANLHDVYHVVDGDRLVDIWPMEARGVL